MPDKWKPDGLTPVERILDEQWHEPIEGAWSGFLDEDIDLNDLDISSFIGDIFEENNSNSNSNSNSNNTRVFGFDPADPFEQAFQRSTKRLKQQAQELDAAQGLMALVPKSTSGSDNSQREGEMSPRLWWDRKRPVQMQGNTPLVPPGADGKCRVWMSGVHAQNLQSSGQVLPDNLELSSDGENFVIKK